MHENDNMSEEDTIEERQKNELEVLKSIYGDDIVDLRKKGARSKWHPLHVSITLLPLQGSCGFQEIYAKVNLQVKCSERYPNEIPKIILEKSQGMSNSVILELQNQLEEKAEELKGEVMIFELAEHVKGFLHMHNKPGSKSFYEEMLISQKQREQLQREAQQLEIDRERLIILKEIQHRQEILKEEEIRLKKEQKNFDNAHDNDHVMKRRNSFTGRKYNHSSTESSDELLCEHKRTTMIEFSNNGDRKVQRGRCISHSNTSVIFGGMDMETGELLIISEWNISIKNNSDFSLTQRHISSLEQELNYLVKLKHQNLGHYLNMKWQHVNDNKIIVYTLREFIYGTTCFELFISESIPVEIDMVRHIVMGILCALDFLHRNNVVHKDLCSSCVYISKKGIVKVANYSLDRRLTDLVTQTQSSSYSKKTDIHKFGVLILSLLKGKEDATIEIPQLIPNDLYDFLSKCLAEDEKERSTAFQLLNHQFLKTPLERHLPQRDVEDIIEQKHNTPEHQASDLKLMNQNSSFGQSRVESEFKIMHCVGKGAFGEVFKVQNNLDQGFYAIKRIELNPKNKQLNRKIIREVKLLSRLNHENVVRYYNSWIETASIRYGDDSNATNTGISFVTPVQKVDPKKELTFKDDIELLAPPIRDVEWSISYDAKSKNESNSTSDESSDGDDDWGLMLGNIESDSDSIEFERDELDEISHKSYFIEPNMSIDVTDSVSQNREYQYMYIQMEFCEKSTLRTAIDAGLYTDKERGWRLFREIIEGLAHIHQQGMIHRDLKPVNIFLDSNDHVKIGDFGLATTNLVLKTNETILINKSDIDGTHDGIDISLTGHVGTALYVAPELTSTAKAMYNHKVDIYSLGIIFFEMCYKPLSTSMERINILTSLRSKEIIFPADFKELCSPQQEFVIRWLLNHDFSKRPTSQELIQSDHIPPPVLEECELRELVRNTLSNPHLKAYKYLIASCFKQPVSCAQDVTFDRDPSIPNIYKHLQMYNHVKQVIIKIFKLHGGQNLSTPLLMPKSGYYDNVDSSVMLMTHSGSVVSVPHDLRVPFARYVAWNGIKLLRRFSVERVYREKKIFGYIPRELYECAFDIVTPTPGNFIVDAELFYILKDIIDKLPSLSDKNIQIRMNHTLLLKAILLHCGIKDKHKDIYDIFSDAREGKVTKFQVHSHLISLGLSDNTIVTLFSLLESELPINKIVSHLQMITKKKSSEASGFAKQALQELKLIIQNIEAFGIELNIVIAPGMMYNIQQYSGMMFQLVCELKKKHRRGCMDVLAAGGRYDGMIASYRNILEKANMLGKDIHQSAVGVSVSLDKLVQALIKDQTDEKSKQKYKPSHLDAVICSVGPKPLLKEKTKVMTELWTAGIKCSLIETTTFEESQEFCSEYNVPFLITLKDSEQGTVRVQYWEKERLQDKKVNGTELIDHIQQMKISNSIVRTDSKVSCSDRCEQHNHDANVNVLFVTNEKLNANVRRRYENQIKSQLENVFRKLLGDVYVLGLSIDANIIRTLASYLDFENDFQYNKSVTKVLDKYQRHTKNIMEICNEISNLMSGRLKPIIILFSLSDSFYKILL